MKISPNTHLILGGPGAGKTTRLLNIMDEKFTDGFNSTEIAFVSFTKKAVSEAVDRAVAKFDMRKSAFPYFRTLHSLAFASMNIRTNNVLNRGHMAKFSKQTGYQLTDRTAELEEDVESMTRDDQMAFYEGLARNKLILYGDMWAEHETDFSLSDFLTFCHLYTQFKNQNNIYDFTDMLTSYLQSEETVPVKVAIVDEAQDLNPLQWAIINSAFREVPEIYIAGDDDQAIYRWSGADINQFLTIEPNSQEVLPKSHRLTKSVFDLANNISRDITSRYEKDWTCRDSEGEITLIDSVRDAPFDNQESWLIVARNNKSLKKITNELMYRGILYKSKWGSSFKKDHRNMIREAGEDWYYELSQIPAFLRQYYRKLIENNVDIDEDPNIYVGTIHSVKGGEADNVLLVTDVSFSPEGILAMDDELRVFYVAVTRAKERLYVLCSQTQKYFDVGAYL